MPRWRISRPYSSAASAPQMAAVAQVFSSAISRALPAVSSRSTTFIPGRLFEEFAALHQGDGMGVYFSDFVEGLSGECGDDVRDAEFLFADDPGPAALEEFVVGEQASGDGCSRWRRFPAGAGSSDMRLKGCRNSNRGVRADLSVGGGEPGGGFVIASCDALYGDLLHVFSNWFCKKIPHVVSCRIFVNLWLLDSIQGIDAYRPFFFW